MIKFDSTLKRIFAAYSAIVNTWNEGMLRRFGIRADNSEPQLFRVVPGTWTNVNGRFDMGPFVAMRFFYILYLDFVGAKGMAFGYNRTLSVSVSQPNNPDERKTWKPYRVKERPGFEYMHHVEAEVKAHTAQVTNARTHIDAADVFDRENEAFFRR